MSFIAPMFDGLFEGHEEKARTADDLDLSVGPQRESLDKLRALGVTGFSLAIVMYPPSDSSYPLQYPSSTGYCMDRTYSGEELVRISSLQESVTRLVLGEMWNVLPASMCDGDALLVRVCVNLGADWESTKIVGYAGAIQIMYGRHNEPFILK